MFMTTTIGYHPAIGVENFGMSLSALNLISGFGCYFNTFGVGNIASSSSYSFPFPGDVLVSTASTITKYKLVVELHKEKGEKYASQNR